jgi:hypothetical protein
MKTFFYALAVLTSAAGLSYPSQARAEYWSDNDLLNYCKAKDGTFEKGACTGYILGIADTLAGGGQIGNLRACITGGVSIGQLADTVTHFLTTSSSTKNGAANTSVASALSNAFPCK